MEGIFSRLLWGTRSSGTGGQNGDGAVGVDERALATFWNRLAGSSPAGTAKLYNFRGCAVTGKCRPEWRPRYSPPREGSSSRACHQHSRRWGTRASGCVEGTRPAMALVVWGDGGGGAPERFRRRGSD